MPLTITIPERELYDEANNRFIDVPKATITLEHSLLSISKWESKWHKSYLSATSRTKEEQLDYVRCMTISQNVNPLVYLGLTRSNWKEINNYISDPMTATTINRRNQKQSRDIITNEVVYYWMTELNIPFQPCEKWHINRLLMLIEVASIKRQPSKKMSPSAVMRNNHSLNAARRAKHHTRG